MFAAVVDKVLLGHSESVQKCLRSAASGQDTGFRQRFVEAAGLPAPAVTVASDVDPSAALVKVLGTRNSETEPLGQQYRISTSFTPNAIQRVEVSDLGLIGSIVEQLAREP